MNRDLLIIYFIIGVVLAGLEIYLVQYKKISRGSLPIIVFGVSIIVAILFVAVLGAFMTLMQLVVLVSFYIEDWPFKKNKDTEKN